MCGNRVELLEVFARLRLDRRGGGADQHRVDGAADRVRARATAARGCSSIEDAIRSIGWRRADLAARALRGDRGSSAMRRRARRPASAPRPAPRCDAAGQRRRRDRAPPMRPSRRHARDPLHLGHHRPGQGRRLPARAVPLVGRQHARASSASAPSDVLCTTLPLFHINALNTFAQAVARRRARSSSSALLGVGLLAGDARRRARPSSTCSARWCRSCCAQPAAAPSAAHRVRIGLGPGVPAAAGDAFARAHRRRAARRLRLDRDQLRDRHARPTAPRAGAMGWLRPGFDARVVDDDDVELPPGEAGELVLRADEPFAFATGYFGMPEKTVAAWRNLLVPHRRPRRARRRRRFPLRRPHQGRDPPARREHLVVRGRAGAA